MAKKYNATEEEISFYENETPVSLENTTQFYPVEQVQEEQVNFYDNSSNTLRDLPENLPWYQSIPSAAAKSLINGINNFGNAFGPIQPTPFSNSSSNKQTDLKTFLNNQLPSNEGFIENTLERAGQILPFLLTANPAGVASNLGNAARSTVGPLAESASFASGALRDTLLQTSKDLLGPTTRSLIGGASGEFAKELGAPEWLQSIAEIPAQVIPGLGSRIIPTSRQANLIEEGRRLGLNENQIAPLIQTDRKVRVLSKIAARRGGTENALNDSYDAIGKIYNTLSDSTTAQKAIPLNEVNNLAAKMQEKLSSFPAGVRNKVSEDLSDLFNNPITGKSLINFYQDVNYYIGKGDKILGLLKDEITTGLAKISPDLARDFISTNKLAQSYYKISSKLKPNIADDLISGSEGVRLLYGAFTGNFPLIAETIGEGAARQMASQLLVNPRFQNLSQQMVQALNNNKLPAAAKIYDSMLNLARDVDPEAAAYLQRANFSSLGKSDNIEEDQ